MSSRRCLLPLLVVTIMSVSSCAPQIRAVPAPSHSTRVSLWDEPDDLAHRDLYFGPWGAEHAPDPDATYEFLRPKLSGTNPGVVVRDPVGREWHVKQAPHPSSRRGNEGPVEVALGRVLTAVGYHQPPVYFLRSFKMADASGTHIEPGGRFRLHDHQLKDRGTWEWQQNPFVGTKPYQGLLAILMLFNSTDLKNANNTLYEFRPPEGRAELWYVVRDLGAALGETGRLEPTRNDPALFEQSRFTAGVKSGFVRFDFRGLHRELIRHRVTVEDMRWASDLLSRLSDRQWSDAFRAGGYPDDVAVRFIAALRARIAEGRNLASTKAALRKGR